MRHFDFENNIIWCRFEGHKCYHFNKPMSEILRRKLAENWLVLAFNGTQVTVRGYHHWCLYKMSEWGCHIITPFYLNDPYFLLSPFNLPQMRLRLTYAWLAFLNKVNKVSGMESQISFLMVHEIGKYFFSYVFFQILRDSFILHRKCFWNMYYFQFDLKRF